MANDKDIKQALLGAIRQYRHSQADGYVIAYDKKEIEIIVAALTTRLKAAERGLAMFAEVSQDYSLPINKDTAGIINAAVLLKHELAEAREEIDRLIARIELVRDAAHDAIDEVGAANYDHVIKEKEMHGRINKITNTGAR